MVFSMGITFGTVFTNILVNGILVMLAAGILQCNKIISYKTIKVICICIILNIFKLIFPIEFFFTKSIRLQRIMPDLYETVHMPILNDKYEIADLLIIIWVGVALVKGSRLIHKNLYFRKIISLIPDISTQGIDKIFSQMKVDKSRLKVKRLDVATPVIMGIFRPVILLPETDYGEDELKYILMHEIYHYKHHDLWLKYLLEFVIISYWWYPPVYLLRKQICTVTEISNDFALTMHMEIQQQIEYLQCLIKVAGESSQRESFSLAFAENKRSDLKQRIEVILYNDEDSYLNKIVVYFLLLLTLSTFLFNFEPEFPFPENTFPITEKTYILYEDNNYYIINDGKNMGMVENIEDLKLNILTMENENEKDEKDVSCF